MFFLLPRPDGSPASFDRAEAYLPSVFLFTPLSSLCRLPEEDQCLSHFSSVFLPSYMPREGQELTVTMPLPILRVQWESCRSSVRVSVFQSASRPREAHSVFWTRVEPSSLSSLG